MGGRSGVTSELRRASRSWTSRATTTSASSPPPWSPPASPLSSEMDRTPSSPPPTPPSNLMRSSEDPWMLTLSRCTLFPERSLPLMFPPLILTSLNGPLNYRYAVRKHFVNDAIIGEKTFGPYSDYPMDVECSNGIIHSIGLCFGFY